LRRDRGRERVLRGEHRGENRDARQRA
jgi:hypothetical protein